ncbi:MAG: sulfite exporter TauE/SafE family protein [Betaproteobacteria bacterium]|nr:sulfite exporter TauE/SafE family protein [Betaproteobacteria bacterium]
MELLTSALAEYPTTLWIVAPLVVLFAYFLFGIGGFGSAVIMVPLLAHWLPLTFVVPLVVLLDLVASAMVGKASRQAISGPELKRLLPYFIVGIILGVTLLVSLPQRPALIALGLFCLVVGVQNIFSPGFSGAISKWWSIPAGLLGGMLGAMFGTGGPIYIVYLSKRLSDKTQVRATISTIISISTAIRAVSYAISGLLLSLKLLAGVLVLLPLMFLGIQIGSRVHLSLTDVQMRKAVGVLLLMSGASLLLRNLLTAS